LYVVLQFFHAEFDAVPEVESGCAGAVAHLAGQMGQ
jgi:hypothetical protein